VFRPIRYPLSPLFREKVKKSNFLRKFLGVKDKNGMPKSPEKQCIDEDVDDQSVFELGKFTFQQL
jgi:hypothetical protein